MQPNYNKTRRACYRGYIVQGVINNLSPLFFVIFQRDYQVTYGMLSSLILFNFVTQILVDVLCVKFVDRIGYRAAGVTAHLFSTVGLLLLGLLPRSLPSPFAGLAIATVVCAIGGGIVEVIVSPIVDSLPSDAKDAKMSLLHSFYSWGQVGVVLLTTLAVRLLGEDLWWVLPLAWAVLPAFNTVAFLRVPLRPTVSQEEKIPLPPWPSPRRFAGHGAHAMRRGLGALHEPVELPVRRAGPGPAQGGGGPAGARPVRRVYGPGPHRLRPVGAKAQPVPRPAPHRRAVRVLLPGGLPVPGAPGVPVLLRVVRLCRQPDVARGAQLHLRLLPQRGHRHVRGAGRVRGHGLLRGAGPHRRGQPGGDLLLPVFPASPLPSWTSWA